MVTWGADKITSWEVYDPERRMWHAVVVVNGIEVAEKWWNRRETAVAWINAVVARQKAERAGQSPAHPE